jgi:hypothetical protein
VNLAQLAEAGHFTKVFDPGHTISPEHFDLLINVLYSVRASVNAWCSRFMVAFSMHAM